MMERRAHPRLPKGYRLRLRELAFPPSGPWHAGRCRDVSASGLAVEVPLPLAAGSLVEIRLHVPRLNLHHPGFFKAMENVLDQNLCAVARVVRYQYLGRSYLLALTFTSLDPDDACAWERLLERLRRAMC